MRFLLVCSEGNGNEERIKVNEVEMVIKNNIKRWDKKVKKN